jgi:hypothetical protein
LASGFIGISDSLTIEDTSRSPSESIGFKNVDKIAQDDDELDAELEELGSEAVVLAVEEEADASDDDEDGRLVKEELEDELVACLLAVKKTRFFAEELAQELDDDDGRLAQDELELEELPAAG